MNKLQKPRKGLLTCDNTCKAENVIFSSDRVANPQNKKPAVVTNNQSEFLKKTVVHRKKKLNKTLQ